MRPITALASAAALAAGLGGGTAAYQLAAAAGPTTSEPGPAARTAPATPRPASRPLVRFTPCVAPAVRQGNACVTEVVRTVVLPDPAGAPSGTVPPAGPGGGPHRAARGDDGARAGEDRADEDRADEDRAGEDDADEAGEERQEPQVPPTPAQP